MNKFFTIPKLAVYIILLAFAGVFLFLKYPNEIKSRTEPEFINSCFQFLLLVVMGGAVTFVFTTYTNIKEQRAKEKEREKEKRVEVKKSQHKFHNDFIQSYNSVKLLRRMFRARARILKDGQQGDQAVSIDIKIFDSLMQELTKLQLQFEFYIDEADSNPGLFPDRNVNNSLQHDMKLMRDYLNELVAEYENCYKLFPNQHYITGNSAIPLAELPKLTGFIITYNDATDFKRNFREPANTVQKKLLRSLNDA